MKRTSLFLLFLALLAAAWAQKPAENRLHDGQALPEFTVKDIFGRTVSHTTFEGKKTLLAFMRNVDCAMCNLRIHELRTDPLIRDTTKLQVILFLQSSPEYILKTVREAKDLPPFYIVADPDMVLYKQFGAKFNIWGHITGMFRIRKAVQAARLDIPLNTRHTGDEALMPFELLINPDASVNTAYYGSDQGDHMPIEMIYRFVTSPATTAQPQK